MDHVLHINLEPPLEVRLLADMPKLEMTDDARGGLLDWCCGPSGRTG